MSGPSRAINASTLETVKRTSTKSSAATLVTEMATAVALDTKAGFSTAHRKAEQLVALYGQLAANRLP